MLKVSRIQLSVKAFPPTRTERAIVQVSDILVRAKPISHDSISQMLDGKGDGCSGKGHSRDEFCTLATGHPDGS
jgi:hypothetical protein